MALRFTQLEPSFIVEGNAPEYVVQFHDEQTGNLQDPDSVDSLKIFDSSGTHIRSYTPPDITNPQVGEYRVQDQVIDESDNYELRWEYTENGTQKTVATTFEVVPDSDNQTETEIKQHVLHQLGQGMMRVELPSGTLDFCLVQAKRWFAMYMGQTKRTEVFTTAGQQKYDVADDCSEVMSVYNQENLIRASDALGSFGVYGFSQLGMSNLPVEDLSMVGAGSHGFYSSLVQALGYSEMGSRVLSSNMQWEWLPQERKLYLYPEPNTSTNIFVDYLSTKVDLTNPKPEEYHLIQQYTLAEAKEALGRIRGKYQSWATAEGQTSLDADKLLSEAEKLKDKLQDRIKQYAPAGWFLVG